MGAKNLSSTVWIWLAEANWLYIWYLFLARKKVSLWLHELFRLSSDPLGLGIKWTSGIILHHFLCNTTQTIISCRFAKSPTRLGPVRLHWARADPDSTQTRSILDPDPIQLDSIPSDRLIIVTSSNSSASEFEFELWIPIPIPILFQTSEWPSKSVWKGQTSAQNYSPYA